MENEGGTTTTTTATTISSGSSSSGVTEEAEVLAEERDVGETVSEEATERLVNRMCNLSYDITEKAEACKKPPEKPVVLLWVR